MGLQKVTTLADMIRYSRIEARHALRLWIDMLKVLTEKKKEGISYGTLKPGSILIDMKNNIVLVDSPFEAQSRYAAPEFLEGAPADEQTDIFSMGVVLFEMLTGNLKDLHRKPPSRVAEDVPRWIDPIVMRCIMKQRSRRYLDFEELSAALMKLKTVIAQQKTT